MSNPPNRIQNSDMDLAFGRIKNKTNFMVAREQLIQNDLIYGKNVDFRNPPFFEINGEGLVYYEKHHLIPSKDREYSQIVSQILIFLRDLGDSKYNVKKFIVINEDPRLKKVEIPKAEIISILKSDYNYQMNDLMWRILYFTSRFISKHIMGINGIGITNNYLFFHNPAELSLNENGLTFLNEVFFVKKFKNIQNNDGRNRISQLYNDLNIWIINKRWIDVSINMGTIIEYLIDNYIEARKLKEFYNKNGNIYDFNKKLVIILENPKKSSDPVFDPKYQAVWKRIQLLKDFRNYIHVSKLVKERNPLDEKTIQYFYNDFEKIIDLLLNL